MRARKGPGRESGFYRTREDGMRQVPTYKHKLNTCYDNGVTELDGPPCGGPKWFITCAVRPKAGLRQVPGQSSCQDVRPGACPYPSQDPRCHLLKDSQGESGRRTGALLSDSFPGDIRFRMSEFKNPETTVSELAENSVTRRSRMNKRMEIVWSPGHPRGHWFHAFLCQCS